MVSSNATLRGGGTHFPLDVKALDVILFGRHASQELKLDRQEFLITRVDGVEPS